MPVFELLPHAGIGPIRLGGKQRVVWGLVGLGNQRYLAEIQKIEGGPRSI